MDIETYETEVWLDIAKDTEYLKREHYVELISGYDEINRMLYGMIDKPEKFLIRKQEDRRSK